MAQPQIDYGELQAAMGLARDRIKRFTDAMLADGWQVSVSHGSIIFTRQPELPFAEAPDAAP